MQNSNDPNKPTVVTPEEARQGETTGRMRLVLFSSLVLALIAGIGFAIYY